MLRLVAGRITAAADGLKAAILDYMKNNDITPPDRVKIEPAHEEKCDI